MEWSFPLFHQYWLCRVRVDGVAFEGEVSVFIITTRFN